MSEWDKLKEHKFLTAINKDLYIEDFMTQMWAVGDGMRDAIATGYCGECKCHKQTISELQEENKQLQERLGDYTQDNLELMAEVDDKNTRIKVWKHSSEEKQQKLKTGSRMLDDWEKSTSHPDATLINIRNLKKVFAQNTEANTHE